MHTMVLNSSTYNMARQQVKDKLGNNISTGIQELQLD
jgi:hypothetical protein